MRAGPLAPVAFAAHVAVVAVALVALAFVAPAAAEAPGAGPAAAALVADGGSAGETESAQAADPSAPTVAASIDRTEAHVGDLLTLSVTAVAPAAVTDTVRLLPPALGSFEILDSSQSDRDLGDGRKSRRFGLQIAAYQLGDLEIPPLTVEYESQLGGRRQLRTSAIPLTLSRVVDDPQADLQPLARTHDAMVEDRRPIQALLAAGALVVLALVALVVRALVRRLRRRRQRVVEHAAEALPPDEIALERLKEMRARGRFEVAGYQPFHFEIAEVVRAYLGTRYGFDSLEETTTELLLELERVQHAQRSLPAALVFATAAASPAAGAASSPAPSTGATGAAGAPTAAPGPPPIFEDDLAKIRAFLEACDQVKFARAPSSDRAALVLLDAAESIIRSTTAIAAAATLGPASARVAHG